MCQPKPISLAHCSAATGERSFDATLRGCIRDQRRWGGNSGLVHTWLHSVIPHTLVFPFTNAAQPLVQTISGAWGRQDQSFFVFFYGLQKEHRPIDFPGGLQQYIWTDCLSKVYICPLFSFCHSQSTPAVKLNPEKVQLFIHLLHICV